MKNQNIFKRSEFKYLITKEQKKVILRKMADYMVDDEYGKTTICNIYFDTKSNLLIRRSIDKPVYKEKLRVRSYGMADENSKVFVELKKKYDSIVYKRRVSMQHKQALDYLCNGIYRGEQNQIINEIDYFCKYYPTLAPKLYLSYEREAFYAKNDDNFRMTFDENIIWRDYDLSLTSPIYGQKLLTDNMVLMEIKATDAIPIWMTQILSENKIYKTSFSKYGNIYTKFLINKTEKEQQKAEQIFQTLILDKKGA